MTLYGVVELMGHRTRAGAISDAQMGGATLLRIEHPTRADHTGEEPLAEFYAPAAIFSIRPCSADEACKVAAWAWAETDARPALNAAFGEVMDEELEDDDDEDEPCGCDSGACPECDRRTGVEEPF